MTCACFVRFVFRTLDSLRFFGRSALDYYRQDTILEPDDANPAAADAALAFVCAGTVA